MSNKESRAPKQTSAAAVTPPCHNILLISTLFLQVCDTVLNSIIFQGCFWSHPFIFHIPASLICWFILSRTKLACMNHISPASSLLVLMGGLQTHVSPVWFTVTFSGLCVDREEFPNNSSFSVTFCLMDFCLPLDTVFQILRCDWCHFFKCLSSWRRAGYCLPK